MRIGAAALKAGMVLFALSWATIVVAVTAAGTSSGAASGPSVTPTAATVPSIDISKAQSGLAGTCGGSAFDVGTFINIGSSASADVRLSAPGVGTLGEFTDETGKNLGAYDAKYPTFHIPSFGGGLAPNTPITLTITTYSGAALTGQVTFTSSITFNCTTGAIIRAPSVNGPFAQVPAVSTEILLALIAMLAFVGVAELRRRAR